MKVVFYCHFPDLLLAQHTTTLRRIYRRPIDFIEQITTGSHLFHSFYFVDYYYYFLLSIFLILALSF